MAIDAHILEDKSERARAEEQRLARQANMSGVMLTDYSRDANMNRKPDYLIYVYTISKRRFEVRRPPSFPSIVFEPCGEDEEYRLAKVFPSPVNESVWMEDRTFMVGVDGDFFVRGVLNPGGVWGERKDSAVNAQTAWYDGGTADLTRRGLFMSHSMPPKPEELQACRTRMEAHFRSLLQNGDELDRNNRRREIGPEHHAAAEYFSYKANWHYTQTAPTPCPNCGELVRPGLAYHMNAMNQACILDWKRAVAAGVKKAEEVPANQRWEGLEKQGTGNREQGTGKAKAKANAAALAGAEIEIDAPAPELDLTGE